MQVSAPSSRRKSCLGELAVPVTNPWRFFEGYELELADDEVAHLLDFDAETPSAPVAVAAVVVEGKIEEAGRLLFKVKNSMPQNNQLQKLIEDPAIRRAMDDAELALYQDPRKTELYALKEEAFFSIDAKSNEADLSERGRAYRRPRGRQRRQRGRPLDRFRRRLPQVRAFGTQDGRRALHRRQLRRGRDGRLRSA